MRNGNGNGRRFRLFRGLGDDDTGIPSIEQQQAAFPPDYNPSGESGGNIPGASYTTHNVPSYGTSSAPAPRPAPSASAGPIVTMTEGQGAGLLSFGAGDTIMGLPKWLVIGGLAFAVYWFWIRES